MKQDLYLLVYCFPVEESMMIQFEPTLEQGRHAGTSLSHCES